MEKQMNDVMRMAEFISELSVSALAAHVCETYGPATQDEELTKLLSLKSRIKSRLQDWEQIKGGKAEAYYEAARVCYTQEEAEMQTSVDPIYGPWDVSESEDGSWVKAWVWVPNEEVAEQLAKIEDKTKAPW
jgi:hypothetical protein